jgi:hypothetical protein
MYFSDHLPASHPLWRVIIWNWTGTAEEILAELTSELGPKDAVNEEGRRWLQK